ncbi:MAG: non-heme iron oxygenase ferredoxin subunit [Dehalococcoidia bacterium]|nr:non-heme iron oxygenase ferredoxin subunit [Dehalococcoidia bacterium]
MTWVTVAKVGDVAPSSAQVVEIDGLRLALCNTGDGYYTIDDVCTHDGGPLDQGELEGIQIECPRHGARFDVTTGRAVRLPAVRPVKTYATRVAGDTIEVEIP